MLGNNYKEWVELHVLIFTTEYCRLCHWFCLVLKPNHYTLPDSSFLQVKWCTIKKNFLPACINFIDDFDEVLPDTVYVSNETTAALQLSVEAGEFKQSDTSFFSQL